MQDVVIVVRIVLAATFLTAAAAKMGSSAATERAVRELSLGLAGTRLSRLVAKILPGAEFSFAFSFAIGLWLTVAAVVAGAMLLLFTVSMAINLARGKQFHCNCFGSASAPISIGTLGRNALLINGCLLLAVASPWVVSVFASLRAGARLFSDSSAVALLMAGGSLYVILLSLDALGSLYGRLPAHLREAKKEHL